MILLRLLSILAGGLILVIPPMFMFAHGTGQQFFDPLTVSIKLAEGALLASSFFFIGFAGDRMRKSGPLRALGALLLAVPFIGGIAMLVRADDEWMLWLAATLICLAAVLFVAFVFPAVGSEKHRPMRRREPREPKLKHLALD
jgi:peptidoglycan/LPS O-acetylase OafA/YrhL